MADYLRAYVPGGSYFFTVASLERGRRLLTENIEALREAFGSVRARRPFRIDAIVILPDHPPVPLEVTTERFGFFNPLAFDRVVFARAIAPGERLSTRRQTKHERGVWQRRFWEHAGVDVTFARCVICLSSRLRAAGTVRSPLPRLPPFDLVLRELRQCYSGKPTALVGHDRSPQAGYLSALRRDRPTAWRIPPALAPAPGAMTRWFFPPRSRCAHTSRRTHIACRTRSSLAAT